jgi:signal transduction histidine kinase
MGSQISMYILKDDFDTLFEERTKKIISLINIKDTYKINIYDTLEELNHKYLTYEQSNDVIRLGIQLLNKNWDNYKKTNLKDKVNKNIIVTFIKNYFINFNDNNFILKKSIINNIENKRLSIENEINFIMKSYRNNLNSNVDIKQLYFKINSIDISLSNLSNYDMNLAIDEKALTEKRFNIITLILNLFIFIVFMISILSTRFFLRYLDMINLNQEKIIQEKTKELIDINSYLEIKIKREVAYSRRKDIVIFQQSKLVSLGEMLNNIAHQWRQPLATILIIIQSFQSKMELGKLTLDMVKDKSKDAMLLAKNMSNTLEDFQNFFNPNKNKSVFCIEDCIKHSLELSKYSLTKNNIEIIINRKDIIKINSYYNELSHVILNMISNSIDALKKKNYHKLIIINIYKNKDIAVIEFIDNGGGIKDEIIENIFEPYYTTKYKSAGTGVGLYMSKQIIEKHMNGVLKCKNIKYKHKNETFKSCIKFKINLPIVKY